MINPFQDIKFLGFVSQVRPGICQFHYPSYEMSNAFNHYGNEFSGGVVGNYVVIQGLNFGYLGKIHEVTLPDKDYLYKSQNSLDNNTLSPLAKVELLMSFDLFDYKVSRSIIFMPQIGSRVYVSHPDFLNLLLKKYMNTGAHNSTVELVLGYLVGSPETELKLPAKTIFGRHCAILGTTGGGKSYTVASLFTQLVEQGGKAVLLDPTGEYAAVNNAKKISLGDSNIGLHYSNLLIEDLFSILTPTGQSQRPILLEAIRSLKALKHCPDDLRERLQSYIKEGNIQKSGHSEMNYLQLLYQIKQKTSQIDDQYCDFDFNLLQKQLTHECVSTRNGGDTWQNDPRTRENIIYLILRVQSYLGKDTPLSKLFMFDNVQLDKNSDIISMINKMSKDGESLIVDLSKLQIETKEKELILNCIGRILLNNARNNMYINNPYVIFIDEAHNFLNKKILRDNNENYYLNSFDNIAKECRKLGIYLCLSTQMPRDIPIGTLSQFGSFIVHRLINEIDKKVVAEAVSGSNKATLDYLPIFGEGEAIFINPDVPLPLTVKIKKPNTNNEPILKLPFDKMFKSDQS